MEVNRIKQFFDCDDPLIEPPANLDPVKDPSESDDEQFKLVTEPCGNKPFDNISSQELDKIITLTDSQKLPQPKWLNENRQNADNHLSIICAQEKQNKCLLKSGKQGVANSVEKTTF